MEWRAMGEDGVAAVGKDGMAMVGWMLRYRVM
jgi:hypothetical protein